MITRIFEDTTFPYFSANIYYLEDSGYKIVIDTGNADLRNKIEKAFLNKGIEPESIDIVVNTHVHYDHCGNNDLFTNAHFFIPKDDWSEKNVMLKMSSLEIKEYLGHLYKDIPSKNLRTFSRLTANQLGPLDEMSNKLDRTTLLGRNHILTPNIQLYFCRGGHTSGHLSLIYCDDNRSHSICGDIFGTADLFDSVNLDNLNFVLIDKKKFSVNIRKHIDRFDVFYPGHGSKFFKEEYVSILRKQQISLK